MNKKFDALFGEAPENVQGSQKPISVTAAPAKTALAVDRWGMLVSERMKAEWGGYEDDLHLIADCHTAAFEPRPQLNSVCTDPVRQKWISSLLTCSDFQALHVSTRTDEALSEIATHQLVKRFRQYESSLTDEEKEELEDGEDPIEAEMKRARSIRSAVNDAQQDVSDAKAAAEAFSCGCGANAGSGERLSPEVIENSFAAVRNNESLREITEYAGRFTALAKSMQVKKPVHGMDDVVGVTLDGEIGRLVPSELMQLADEDLELDLLRRITEKQALCREYKGVTGLGRGPIMVMVDESASMHGDRIHAAKGFALSMGWLAQHQRRWCCLVGWSSRSEQNALVMQPGRVHPAEVKDWCCHFFQGGTTPPLELVPQLFEQTGAPEGKTDVIWITDGNCRLRQHQVDRFNQWREEANVKVWTIGIQLDPQSFHPITDTATYVTGLNTSEPIVHELMSL